VRGQVLMPWPNRIAEGRTSCRSPASTADRRVGARARDSRPGALGRVARGAPRHRRSAALSATASVRGPATRSSSICPSSIGLSPSGLTVTFGALNVGSTPCPFGVRAHPYFSLPGVSVDEVELCVPASDWLEVDARVDSAGAAARGSKPGRFPATARHW